MPTISTEDQTLDFASITLSVENERFDGIKSTKYSDKLERKKVYGTGNRPIGRTSGTLDPQCEITMYRKQFEKLRRLLGGTGFAQKIFTITVKHALPGQDIITDVVKRCFITDWDGGGTQGADALEVTVKVDTMEILWNGDSPLRPQV
jgi:hypothetical protein